MYGKSLGCIIVLAISLAATAAYGQSRSPTGPVGDFVVSDHANGSVFIISEQETEIPGYVRVHYAFIDQSCGVILVDRYGPPIDPNSNELRSAKQRVCTEIATDARDGD